MHNKTSKEADSPQESRSEVAGLAKERGKGRGRATRANWGNKRGVKTTNQECKCRPNKTKKNSNKTPEI